MSTPDADAVRSRLIALRLAMESLEGLARSPREEKIAAEGRQALQELEAWLLAESEAGERAA
jgi:hypothetical protein